MATHPLLLFREGASTAGVYYVGESAGTVYTLTASMANAVFGTTSPVVTLAAAGTYLLIASASYSLVGATFLATRAVEAKLRRTNNAAADIAGAASDIQTGVTTLLSQSLGTLILPTVVYVASAGDVIALQTRVSVLASAGSVTCTKASLIALRIL